ncbi:hypothetical protein [Arthrobacter sp. ISL-30]|uniref:hypothetical protein n=1 Tax=Arthrobacter sp. ISL-30 TaxID=2819109 RepID=UPI001BED02CF|nr:hypothetical protein [Arthrobacter sp. ISL-30]MBT2514502.1 hypothetical protein [Arthrobacter sp. ISL-30]
MLPRRLLFRSSIWEVARPRTPLTEGHLLVRLSDPSVAFAEDSAADWLLCHNIARGALSRVLGAERCGLMFAYEWHPLGDAIGEPAAESSTPTFHLFGRWAGESLTPADQLLIPASHRVPTSENVLDELDGGLRSELQRQAAEIARTEVHESERHSESERQPETDQQPKMESASDVQPASDAEPASGVEHQVESEPPAESEPLPVLARWKATQEPGSGYRVFTPVRPLRKIGDASPQDLLSLATGIMALPVGGAASGFSCVVSEADESHERLQLHALGRSRAEKVNPLEIFLRSSEVSHTLL